jgi:protein SCO1/2
MKLTCEVALGILVTLLLASSAAAQPNVADPAVMFSYEQKLNAPLPLDVKLTDEAGNEVTLGSFFGKRPVIFAMIQYRCPKLCNQVLSGLTQCAAEMSAKAGADYEVVVVSIDHREKAMPQLARDKKAAYIDEYLRIYQKKQVGVADGRPLTDAAERDLRASLHASWHFLTADLGEIERLAVGVGFRYSYNPQADRYAHPSGVVVVTAKGINSRYLDGILFRPEVMQEALDKAARNEIGRPMTNFQRVLLLCYDFDAETGTMKANVMKIVRTAGVVTVVALAGFVFFGGYLRRGRGVVPPPGDSAAYFKPKPAQPADGISTSGEIRS